MQVIDMNVAVTLQIRRDHDAWLADLRFRNVGEGEAPLLTFQLPANGVVSSDVVTIAVEAAGGGTRVAPHVGPRVKRSAPGREHFIMLSPGQELAYTVDLSACYRISPAARTGRAAYAAYHGDVDLFGRLWQLRSNHATL